jgi:hypothetical protein
VDHLNTPNRWLILATMTGALSMVMIDQTVRAGCRAWAPR